MKNESTPDGVCGICGKPNPDKMALWTGGGRYWPVEFIPKQQLVHAECETIETKRAFDALTPEERHQILVAIMRE